MIYLDNAATTIHKPPQVAEAMIEALKCCGNSARGTYEAGLASSRIIYEARERIASLFHCPKPGNVVFTSNVTEALNIALSGTVQEGGRILTTELEHNSVLRPLYRLREENGVEIDFIPTGKNGNPVYEAVPSLIQRNTYAVVCTHASNLTGNLVDIDRIGNYARKHKLLFIVDAAQTAGEFPLNMEKSGIDILCFTGHKALMGPQGTGGLCIGNGVEIRPWKVGGTGVQSHLIHQPEQYPIRLEAGTLNTPGIAGLSKSVQFLSGSEAKYAIGKSCALMRRFYNGIKNTEGVKVYGDFSGTRAPIVAINIKDYDSNEIADILWTEYSIAVRAGAHCAPLMHKALNTEKQGAVRFSFSMYNTEEETDCAIRAVTELASR